MPTGLSKLENTAVLIVGGGPAGLVLAIELGRRGIDHILVEQGLATSTQPNANLSSARTMEYYWRQGFADEVGAVGVLLDYPQDVFGKGFTLARFEKSAPGAEKLIEAAETAGVPIIMPDSDDTRARALYECDLVLVRPDQHVCWRGNSVDEDPETIVATVAGWSSAAT